jgi:hypothetical protein
MTYHQKQAMTKTPAPHEYPLFGSKGELFLVPESVLDHWPAEAVASYQRVCDSYTTVAVIENKIDDATNELHRTVAELREVEHRVAVLPRPTHLDLVRQMSRENR